MTIHKFFQPWPRQPGVITLDDGTIAFYYTSKYIEKGTYLFSPEVNLETIENKEVREIIEKSIEVAPLSKYATVIMHPDDEHRYKLQVIDKGVSVTTDPNTSLFHKMNGMYNDYMSLEQYYEMFPGGRYSKPKWGKEK